MLWFDENFVAFDFETSGKKPEYALQPWRLKTGDAWLTSFAAVRRQDNKLRDMAALYPEKIYLKQFLKDAIDMKLTMVGWNVVFDISWFLALGPEFEELVFQLNWLDGMLLWRHFFIEPEYDMNRANKKSYTLKNMVRELFPQHGNYEEGIEFHGPLTPEQLKKLEEYNIRDCVFTLRGAKYFYTRLEEKQLRNALIEARALPFIAKANLDGMLVDTVTTHEVGAYLDKVAAEQLAKLSKYGVTEKVVRSPKQLSALMFNDWQLPILKTNKSKKTGNETASTDKEALHELSFIDHRASKLRKFREALNNKGKFVNTILESVAYNGDGRTHPQAIPFGTYSGRMTYGSKQGKGATEVQTGFAIHQTNRDKMYRSQIVADDGCDIVEFDASGQEFRWMAVAANDPVMLQLCMPGEDPHSFMGARIEERDYKQLMELVKKGEQEAKDARQLGKVGNLSLQYRTSAPKLRSVARVQYNLPMEMPEARRIHSTYQKTYNRVPLYWDTQIQLVKKLGYAETFGGRRVQVTGDWSGNWGWSMGSTAINYRIQGTGADQKYLALSVIKPLLLKYRVRFMLDMHDGLYFQCPVENTEKFRREAKFLLDNLPYQKAWGFTPPIPMPWDCKVGKSWGTLQEVK